MTYLIIAIVLLIWLLIWLGSAVVLTRLFYRLSEEGERWSLLKSTGIALAWPLWAIETFFGWLKWAAVATKDDIKFDVDVPMPPVKPPRHRKFGTWNPPAETSMKYRKKPIVIDAFQMTTVRRQDNRDWPEWLNKAWQYDHGELGGVGCEDYPQSDGTDRLVINTLEGAMTVDFDDWIIKDVKGELYPCKPDIFEVTYEPVNSPPPPPPPRVTSDDLREKFEELEVAIEAAKKRALAPENQPQTPPTGFDGDPVEPAGPQSINEPE